MRKLFIFLFVSVLTMLNAETALFVNYFAEEESEYALSLIGRVEIKDEIFRLISVDGEELASCNLYEVRKLTFSDSSTDVGNNFSLNEVSFYPNPTQNVLFVNGLNSNEIVRLYTLNGVLLSTHKASNEGNLQLDVAQLSQGSYILQVGIQVVKFIKQ